MAYNEITHDGIISGGANTFTGLSISSDNYEVGIRDITISPERGKRKNEPLKPQERFDLMPEACELILIARIALPGALRDASIWAQNSESIEQAVINPSDFGEIGEVGIAKATANIKFS